MLHTQRLSVHSATSDSPSQKCMRCVFVILLRVRAGRQGEGRAAELAARVANAAARKYAQNLSDAELAKAFNVSPHTIADWKKHPQWKLTIEEVSSTQLMGTLIEMRAMASAAREVLFEQMRDGPPALRTKIAMMVCEWAIKTSV